MRQSGLFGFSDQLKRLSDCGDPLETMSRVVDFEIWAPTSTLPRAADGCAKIRWNRGGFTSQAVLDVLRRTWAGEFVNRQGALAPLPLLAPPRAMAVLVNAFTASDGDQFAYYFHAYGLGPVVGERSWGGVQGIRGPWPLMDGTTITIPKDSLASTDGHWIIENEGVTPNVPISPAPDEATAGGDRQLDVAVSTVLKAIAAQPNAPLLAPPSLPSYPVGGTVPPAAFGRSGR